MLKIYCYECRRLLGGKSFLGMTAVTLLYAVQLLRVTVIWGIADTAPFSPWSFGYYLGALLPFLCGAGLLPLPVLVLGLGMALGKWGTAPLYGLAVVLFLLPRLPGAWEPTGLAFFRDFPVALGTLDAPLQIPLSLWLSRGFMLLAGLMLLCVGTVKEFSID